MDILIPKFTDLVDIAMIAFFVYQALNVVKRSGGYQLLISIIILFVVYTAALVLDLRMVSAALGTLRSYWIIVLVILFQPEIRTLLAKLNISRELSRGMRKKKSNSLYMPLIDAISSMSFRKTGALIVIENKRRLSEYIQSGELIDAELSLRLILTIFNPKSALHDGAVIIRGDRIMAAKVVLPLSKKPEFVRIFGTRHLAGIGITEATDAIAIIVSEQNSQISVAQHGSIQVNVAYEELLQIITDAAG